MVSEGITLAKVFHYFLTFYQLNKIKKITATTKIKLTMSSSTNVISASKAYSKVEDNEWLVYNMCIHDVFHFYMISDQLI